MINTELHNGDCLEYMKKIPTSSIDLIITDPPYNLGKFMEERDTNLVKMRDNFFGAAGWDEKVFGSINGCFWKKSIKTGSNAFESARDLSSSGESDFFSTTMSGCAFRKSLL